MKTPGSDSNSTLWRTLNTVYARPVDSYPISCDPAFLPSTWLSFVASIKMSTSSHNLYEYYVPSNVAAIVVAAVFFILILLHTWKVISTRQWFATTTIVGGICESSAAIHMTCELF